MGLKFGLALNKRLVLEDLQLKDQDVIAILPPFSGG
jgi:molybdopterin converting factor small subunit